MYESRIDVPESFEKLAEEDRKARGDEEELHPPTPGQCALHTFEWRCGFLESYIWYGEEMLFEAVARIWDLLNEPKNARCITIGLAAGTGGSGKWALARFLRRALRDALGYERVQPHPKDYATLEEFHQATMSYFADDYAHYERMVQKYADILGGEPGRHAPGPTNVVPGPWIALLARPEGGRAIAWDGTISRVAPDRD